MKKNRLFSALLAVSILFTATAYADFSDMPENEWEQRAIQNAVTHGILSGYDDGTVRPYDPITRAEMASIITRACNVTNKADLTIFIDVPKDAWYFEVFQKAYYMGAFKGNEEYQLSPENNITFQETFTVLSQVFDLLPPYTRVKEAPETISETEIYDSNKRRLYDISILGTRTDTWSLAPWSKVFAAGVIAHSGCNGILIDAGKNITRAEFAIIMDNLIQNYIDDPDEYTSLPEGNTMIRCNGVFLTNVNTAYDIILADGIQAGGISMENVTARRLVVRGCANAVDSNNQLLSDSFGLVISGSFDSIRIIRPYIIADLMYADYKKIYTAPGTSVNLGRLQED